MTDGQYLVTVARLSYSIGHIARGILAQIAIVADRAGCRDVSINDVLTLCMRHGISAEEVLTTVGRLHESGIVRWSAVAGTMRLLLPRATAESCRERAVVACIGYDPDKATRAEILTWRFVCDWPDRVFTIGDVLAFLRERGGEALMTGDDVVMGARRLVQRGWLTEEMAGWQFVCREEYRW